MAIKTSFGGSGRYGTQKPAAAKPPMGYWGGPLASAAANKPGVKPSTGLPNPTGTINDLPGQPTYNPLLEGAYNTQSGNADTARRNTLGAIAGDENRNTLDYGFNIARNPDGTVNIDNTLGSVQGADANPFSKMSLLTRAYQQQTAGTNTGYAAQGQAFSGALQNAQANNTFNYNQGGDALKKALTAILAGDTGQRLGATDTYNTAVDTAAWNRLQGYLNGTSS